MPRKDTSIIGSLPRQTAFDGQFDDIWQELLIIYHYSLLDAISDRDGCQKRVINQWLVGDSRDKATTNNRFTEY